MLLSILSITFMLVAHATATCSLDTPQYGLCHGVITPLL